MIAAVNVERGCCATGEARAVTFTSTSTFTSLEVSGRARSVCDRWVCIATRRNAVSGRMERWVGPLAAEIVEAEGDRYTAPMLLLHGLWSTAGVWRRFMGHLAHRGWRCLAIQLQRHVGNRPATSVAEHAGRIREAIATLEAPPVIVGHDLGALLALLVADTASAIAAFAPLAPPPLGPPLASLRDAMGWRSRFAERPVRTPRGRWLNAYLSGEHAPLEPVALIRHLLTQRAPGLDIRAPVPRIVFAGERDPVTSASVARALADRVGAEFRLCAGAGHALPVETGWQDRVSALHRWTIQRLGASLLAFHEEELDEGAE